MSKISIKCTLKECNFVLRFLFDSYFMNFWGAIVENQNRNWQLSSTKRVSTYAALPLLSIWFLTKYFIALHSRPSKAGSASLHLSQSLLQGTTPLLMKLSKCLWTASLSFRVHGTGSEQNKIKIIKPYCLAIGSDIPS